MMNSDISDIATIGKWSSLSAAFFTAVSAVAICPWYFDFDSNGSVNFVCWLLVAPSYLVMTICYKYVVSLQKNILDSFYAELAVTFATAYAVYECAIYYLQLTYLLKTRDSIEIKAVFMDGGGSPIMVLDLFGYFSLSVSTIFLAMSGMGKKDMLLKYLLRFHGWVGATVIFVPALSMIYAEDSAEDDNLWQCVLLFWCAQFIPACGLMSMKFGSFQDKTFHVSKGSTSGVGSRAQ